MTNDEDVMIVETLDRLILMLGAGARHSEVFGNDRLKNTYLADRENLIAVKTLLESAGVING